MAPEKEHCDAHTGMHSDIRVNGALIQGVDGKVGKVEGQVEKLFAKHDDTLAAVNELTAAFLSNKVEVAEKEVKKARHTLKAIIKYGVMMIKGLVFIIVGLAGGTILISDSTTIVKAINTILFKIR